MDNETAEKIKKMQEIRAEYTRRLNVLRKEQSDIVDRYRLELEEEKKEKIMSNLSS
jgi:F0F1-type ATP synthase membrane subunit b/b'